MNKLLIITAFLLSACVGSLSVSGDIPPETKTDKMKVSTITEDKTPDPVVDETDTNVMKEVPETDISKALKECDHWLYDTQECRTLVTGCFDNPFGFDCVDESRINPINGSSFDDDGEFVYRGGTLRDERAEDCRDGRIADSFCVNLKAQKQRCEGYLPGGVTDLVCESVMRSVCRADVFDPLCGNGNYVTQRTQACRDEPNNPNCTGANGHVAFICDRYPLSSICDGGIQYASFPSSFPKSIKDAQNLGMREGVYEDTDIEGKFYEVSVLNNREFVGINTAFDVGDEVPIIGRGTYAGQLMLYTEALTQFVHVKVDVDFTARTFTGGHDEIYDIPDEFITLNGTFDGKNVTGVVTHKYVDETECRMLRHVRAGQCISNLISQTPTHRADVVGFIGVDYMVGAFGSHGFSGGFQLSPRAD